MKARMRNVYIATVGDTEWRGDCPAWAAGFKGQDVKVRIERHLWIGPAWRCHCKPGSHS